MLRFLTALALVVMAGPALAGQFSGRMSFYDADTLHVGGRKVRLFGIDAPEAAQTCTRTNGESWACGAWATAQAKRLFEGRPAVCQGRGRDIYGRTVASCTLRGFDIGEILVERGIAAAYERYSRNYLAAERTAHRARLGIWQGGFQRPAQWRAIHAAQPTPAGEPPKGCAIKGNISSGGRIYHVPGQEHYAATRIDPSRGERWFCTETQARAAGWRRARR